MNVATEQCKKLIVEWCKDHMDFVIAQFYKPTPNEVEDFKRWCVDEKNWNECGARESVLYPQDDGLPEGSYERCFDCEPFDDQLRGYVITDPTDTNILSVRVVGE